MQLSPTLTLGALLEAPELQIVCFDPPHQVFLYIREKTGIVLTGGFENTKWPWFPKIMAYAHTLGPNSLSVELFQIPLITSLCSPILRFWGSPFMYFSAPVTFGKSLVVVLMITSVFWIPFCFCVPPSLYLLHPLSCSQKYLVQISHKLQSWMAKRLYVFLVAAAKSCH